MKPPRAAVLSIPLVAAGSLAAHALAYRLALPDAHTRAQALADSGHGYLRYSSAFFPICVALVLAYAIGHGLNAVAGRASRHLPIRPFLLLPMLLFTVQEHAERFFKTGAFPFDAVLARTFFVGILLQLPVGLIAYAIARIVVALADGIGRLLAGNPPHAIARPQALRPPHAVAELARIPVLALHAAGRAPPSASLAS
jgi:hypothetical protein